MWGTNTLGRSAYFPSSSSSSSSSFTPVSLASTVPSSSSSSFPPPPIAVPLNHVPLPTTSLDQRKFPSVRTVLWDRPGTESSPIHISYRATIPSLQLSKATLNKLLEISVRHRLATIPPTTISSSSASTLPTTSTATTLIPHKQTLQIEFEPPEGPEDPHVFIFHPFNQIRSSSLFVIANLLDDNDTTVTASTNPTVSSTAKSISSSSASPLMSSIPLPEYTNPLCLTIDFNGIKTIEDYRTGMNLITLHIIYRILTPCMTLRFTHLRSPPPRLADTPLTVALMGTGLRGIAAPILGAQCGVLTFDSTRRIVPILPSDPSCRTTPLIGVWIRAPVTNTYELYEDDNWSRTVSTPAWARTALRHPVVRTVLAWYEECPDLGERVRLPDQPYTCLVMLLPPFIDDPTVKTKGINNAPIFFECDVQWPRTPFLTPQQKLQDEYRKNTNISLTQSTSRISSSTCGSSTENIPVPDGWSLITTLVRVRLRCITSSEYEPIFASSDIGNITILPNNEGIRWSLRTTAPYLKKSITQYLAPSIQHSIVHNHYQQQDNVTNSHRNSPYDKINVDESIDTVLNNAVTSVLDYSTSKLPLPSYKRSVTKVSNGKEENTKPVVEPSSPVRPSPNAGAGTMVAISSPSRIPLPKGTIASPRSYNKEPKIKMTNDESSVAEDNDEDDKGEERANNESTEDGSHNHKNNNDTVTIPSFPSETMNETNPPNISTPSGLTVDKALSNPETLVQFKLTPETHQQLRTITEDLSTLSTVLHEHLQPSIHSTTINNTNTKASSSPSSSISSSNLFSDTLRNQLAQNHHSSATARPFASPKIPVSLSKKSSPPDYKAAERIGHVSALLQGLTNTLQSTLSPYSTANIPPLEETGRTENNETVPPSKFATVMATEYNADSDYQTKAAMHRIRTLLAKTNTPLPPVPVSVAPIITQSQQRYPKYTTSDTVPTPVPLTSYTLPSSILQPLNETVVNNFSTDTPSKEIVRSEASSVLNTNENIENIAERTRNKLMVGAQLPSPALRQTIAEIAKSTVLPYNETSTNNMLSSSSHMSIDNINLIHNINNVLSPVSSRNSTMEPPLSASLRWLPTDIGSPSSSSSRSMSASVNTPSHVPVPVTTIVSMKPYSSQSEPVSLLYANNNTTPSSSNFPRGTVDNDYFSLVAPRTEALIRASASNVSQDMTNSLLRTFGQMTPNPPVVSTMNTGNGSATSSTNNSPINRSIHNHSSHSNSIRRNTTPSSGTKPVRTNTPVRLEDVRNDMESNGSLGPSLARPATARNNRIYDDDSDEETYIDPATRREMDLLSSSVLMKLPSSWM